MTVLLDSSVIIDVLRRRRGRRELLASLLGAGHDLACCAISVAEVYSGMRPTEAQATSRFFDDVLCIEINYEIAQRAGEPRAGWRQRGKTLSLPDALIAATALAANLTLATENVKDFLMPDLKFLPLPKG
jgi:predicted nucleic acid-binding protein